MNWPIYMDWDEGSRKCYSRLLVVYAALVIISIALYVVQFLGFPFLDAMTLIFIVISVLVLVLVATGYMILRNPPLESPQLIE